MYLKKKKLRVGLDLDDTIFLFMEYYLKKFRTPKNDYEITRNVTRILSKDKSFWINQPLINRPNFIPTLYCTKRVHNKQWTKEQLEINNLPKAPIYQIYGQFIDKSSRIKGLVDVFVDDSLSNMIEMNLNGIPCLLIDNPANQSWGPIGRIYSLDKYEVEDCYHLFKDTMFPCFKELVREWKTLN